MASPALTPSDRALVDSFLSRRRLLQLATAGGVALAAFSFQMTPEIEAQALRAAHAGLQIGVADFTALVEDLITSLNGNNVPAEAQQLLLEALPPCRLISSRSLARARYPMPPSTLVRRRPRRRQPRK
jgi:hypothetical protein